MKYSQAGISKIYICVYCNSLMLEKEANAEEGYSCSDCKTKHSEQMTARQKERLNVDAERRAKEKKYYQKRAYKKKEAKNV